MTESSAHILVVDDESEIRELLSDLLDTHGFFPLLAADGGQMRSHLSESRVDLLLLDLRLKGEDGMELAREVRAVSEVPILMLTGKGDETDRILGLELAADDFMMKPFNNRELVARIRALLRRSRPTVAATSEEPTQGGNERLCFDGWIMDLTARTLMRTDGRLEQLTFAEFALLEVLVKSPNRVFSREQLLEATRGLQADVFDRTIDVLILRLRRKIEPNPRQPRYIQTERGLGYIFREEVKAC